MNEAIIAALGAAAGGVLTILGKIIVDIIRAKKEPDQSDLELKDELAREKEKNDAAIKAFTDFGKEIKNTIEELRTEINQRFEDMDNRFKDMDAKIDDYRNETREINKSELRHLITEIYYDNCDTKTLSMNTKNDLCSLYESYQSIGGNSFVHELYDEMMDWDVE